MKRHVRSIIALALAAASTFAFAPAQAQSEPTNIRIFVGLGTGTGEEQQTVQNDLAAQWNAENADIQITFDYYDSATASDAFLTQVASGNPPDIVGPAGIANLYTYVDAWADLSSYIEQDAEVLNLSDFDERTLQLYQLPSGQTFSVPLGIYPSVLYVNEDLFRAAEVPLPPKEFGAPYTTIDGNTVPWDYTALADVAELLTQDANGIYANEEGFDPASVQVWGYGDWWSDFRSLCMRFGAETAQVSEDGTTATLNESACREAAQWYHDGIFSTHFIPDQAAADSIQGASPFESGRLGMWISHTWYGCCMSGANFEWGVYAMPAAPGTEGATIVAPMHADSYAVVDSSPNKDAAWEVIKWLASPEVSDQLCQAFGCMPARISARSAWEDRTLETLPQFDMSVINEAAGYADVPSHGALLPNMTAAFAEINNFFGRVRNDADLDVDAAIDEANNNLQRIYEGDIPPTPTPQS
jgi:multiple sugar transport system substrate-binding protein